MFLITYINMYIYIFVVLLTGQLCSDLQENVSISFRYQVQMYGAHFKNKLTFDV